MMLKIFSPYNQHLIKKIPLDGSENVEKALTIAYGLFQSISKWLPAYKRIAILEQIATIMESRIEELTITAVQEGGKPYVDSKVEVLRAINSVKLAAEYIGQIKGEQIPMYLTNTANNRMAFTCKEPIGVVVSVSAFNHPLNLIVHQTAPCIAAGCPVIIKPALTTPLSCLLYLEILEEAGLPKGWCQAIVSKDEISEKLVTDKRVNHFSFIGSAKVGWYLRSKLSPGTRCTLEHGGIAPVIVEQDVNIDNIIAPLVKGGFYHAGQVCVSVQRIFVHEKICALFVEQFTNMVNQLVVGDPLHKSTEVGPLILPKEVDRVEEWVNEAIDKGAKLLCGGKRISNNCYAPTVLLNPPIDVRISTHEVFGPVVCIYAYTDRDKAIEIANSTNFHFQASVFTKDIDIAFDTVNKLNATAVMVNDHTAFRVDWMPFGGRDVSGMGLGGIPYTIREMTREKLIVIKSDVL